MVPNRTNILLKSLIAVISVNYCAESVNILSKQDKSGKRMSNSIQSERDRTLKIGGRYHLPIPTGPYTNIGYFELMTGTNLNDGLLVRIHYPDSNQTVNPKVNFKNWPNWYPSEEYKRAYMNVININSPLLVKSVDLLTSNVFIPMVHNVEPLRLNDQGYPVIIFSHGLSSCRTTYSNVVNEMVSFGFIVFALEHRDRSACTSIYPNEGDSKTFEWLPYKHKKDITNELEERRQQLDIRATEIQRVVNLINDLQNGKQVTNLLEPQLDNQRFAGLFDTNRIIAMGHSFGAASAIRAARNTDSIKLGICLDPWMYPLEDNEANLTSKPILCINAELFQWRVNLIAIKTFIESDGKNTDQRKVFTIKKAIHTDFSDFPFILNLLVKKISKMHSQVDRFVVIDLSTVLSLQFIENITKLKLKENKDLSEEYRNHLTEGLENIE